MSSAGENQGPSTQSIIKELCKYMCSGVDPSDGARMVKSCLTIITHDTSYLNSSLSDNDEFAVVEKIKRHLKMAGRDQNAVMFEQLHRKLVTCSHALMKNRTAILTLFLRLSDVQEGSSINGNMELRRSISQRSFDAVALNPTSLKLGRSRVGCGDPSKLSPSFKGVPTSTKQSIESMNRSNGLPKEHLYSVNVNTERRTNSRSDRPESLSRSLNQTPPRTPRAGKYDVSEMQILQELLFCFQGIEGKILRLDADNGFKIDPLANVPQPQLVKSLLELGYLHNYVQGLCQELEEGGAVARGLMCAVRSQLIEYYRRVAQLNTDLKQTLSLNEDSPMSEENLSYGGLSLRRLNTWTREPKLQFQLLADMCRACVRQRGGAMVSAAYSFSYHGHRQAQALATSLLVAATRPLFTLMCHWIIQGELYDPHDEFFVAADKHCPPQTRWRKKFYLRKELVPAVMSEKQAMMVLNAGKCINFLNEICNQKMAVTGARAKLRQLETAEGGELLQLAEPASPLAIIIESAFMEASQLVLETLKSQFKMFENFNGLRRYMLMGQGDFYRYLIQLLEPELNKCVEYVYNHNLLSILESAIRATNAQFEDKDVLSRLTCDVFDPSLGETGWDVFTMKYITEGPLDTVFELGEGTYSSMFLFMWQLKRVEYCLSNFRKEQTYILKKLQKRTDFAELQAMLNHTSLLTAEMVHYINQVLYYILFEVIECAFESFAEKFTSAATIEEVIRDHELFLQEIKAKTLKDGSAKSQELSTLMSSLNLAILHLVAYGESFLHDAEVELDRRLTYDQKVEDKGTNYAEENDNKRHVRHFNSKLQVAITEISLICHGYQKERKRLKVFIESADLHKINKYIDCCIHWLS